MTDKIPVDCEPDIKGNIIANNRKAGIKIQNFAIATIGGSCKDDIKTLPDMPHKDPLGQNPFLEASLSSQFSAICVEVDRSSFWGYSQMKLTKTSSHVTLSR